MAKAIKIELESASPFNISIVMEMLKKSERFVGSGGVSFEELNPMFSRLLLNEYDNVRIDDEAAVILANILRQLKFSVISSASSLLSGADDLKSVLDDHLCFRRWHLIGFSREEMITAFAAEWPSCPKL